MDLHGLHKDGTEIPVEISLSPIAAEDGTMIMSAIRDITDRKRSMEALRVSENRFKALFQQAAVGVAQADVATGRFVQVNQYFCEIAGRSREELEQLSFGAITHPLDAQQDVEMAQQVLQGTIREYTREKRLLRKDGSEVWVSVTVSAMWALGATPDYFITVTQDVTRRKKLEEQARQTQKLEAVGTLAAGIAHDFNNILAAINGYTELARMTLKDNPTVRAHLGAVLQASGRAGDLIRQILTFSRQQPQERRMIQLRPIVVECLALLRATLPSTIRFDVSLAADAPTVLADATQIHQVLMNLGTNAWHAMKDNPGLLQVKLERCIVDANHAAVQSHLQPGIYAHISVSDTGCGMEQATLRRVFEPFFTTKPPGEGTGLGLAVVHGIMTSHDGAVTVYSEPGEGTVFHLYFPGRGDVASDIVIEGGTVTQGRGQRILFVDDEESLVQLGQNALTVLGYEVETATRPSLALEFIRAEPQRFSLLITDHTMPEMTGLALAQQALAIRPDLPIILLTGYTVSLTSERVAAAGIRQLLLKPTTLHSLGTAVSAALSANAPP